MKNELAYTYASKGIQLLDLACNSMGETSCSGCPLLYTDENKTAKCALEMIKKVLQ